MPTAEDLPVRVLLLPGWMNSGPTHWQSRWEELHGHRRVEQSDWLWPKRGDWMARLDAALLETRTPAVLVAHSLGCQLVAAWAAHSAHTAQVKAALLVAPFVSLVVSSGDDPFTSPERSAAMAADWGSDSVGVGVRGHINGESGLGDWPEGYAMLRALVALAG